MKMDVFIYQRLCTPYSCRATDPLALFRETSGPFNLEDGRWWPWSDTVVTPPRGDLALAYTRRSALVTGFLLLLLVFFTWFQMETAWTVKPGFTVTVDVSESAQDTATQLSPWHMFTRYNIIVGSLSNSLKWLLLCTFEVTFISLKGHSTHLH